MPIHAKTLVKTRKLILSVLLTNPHSVKISRMKKKHELSQSILKLRKVKVKEKSQIKAKNEKKILFCVQKSEFKARLCNFSSFF